jgi:hypothetical protein
LRSRRSETRRRPTPKSVKFPPKIRMVVSCTSPRMTWHSHSWCSARHAPLKFRTTVTN